MNLFSMMRMMFKFCLTRSLAGIKFLISDDVFLETINTAAVFIISLIALAGLKGFTKRRLKFSAYATVNDDYFLAKITN